MSRQPGDKLGPRLASLVLSHTLAMRKGLAPVEAQIRAASTQQLIDRAGREVASLHKLIYDEALKLKGSDVHPALAELLARTGSGEHQWEGLAGLGNNVAMGALGSVVSNFIFPLAGNINLLDRSTPVDANTAASAVAAGILDYGTGDQIAGAWGLRAGDFETLVELARNIPAAAELGDMVNRGLMSEADAITQLARQGIPEEFRGQVLALRLAVLAPADAALAVLRGNMTTQDGYAVAAANGVSSADFDILVGNTGEPPAIEEMVMLNRRGKLSDDLLDTAIRQSRIRDQWIPYVKELGIQPPSTAEVLNALVQGQLSQSEAESRFGQAGGDPTWFATAFASTAESPSPTQLAELANRGVIPWDGTGPGTVSWQQGFLEGRWKDKWAPAFRALAQYRPPPREVATLVREGGMTQDQAMTFWQQAGLPADLAHMYWQAAHYQKTTAVHELAQGEITRLYSDQAISRDEAMKMLESIGWTAVDSDYLLDIVDLQRARSELEAAITKIRSLYIAWKIVAQTATAALAALDVPASQATALIGLWNLERGANVKTLTAAEITDAWYYQLMSPQDAQAALQAIGYTAQDAWLLLNIKNKGPIANYPEPG